jgi:hypothetical protein
MVALLRFGFFTVLAFSWTAACGPTGGLAPQSDPDAAAPRDAGPLSDASAGDATHSEASTGGTGAACRAAGGQCLSSWGGDQCAANGGDWASSGVDDCADGTEAAYACCLPGKVTPFSCGPSLACNGPYYFCQVTNHDADGGAPATYACLLADSACSPNTTCACVTPTFPAQQCSASGNNVTETRTVRDFACGPALSCGAPYQMCLVTELATPDGGSSTSYACVYAPMSCPSGLITCACATAGQTTETCSEPGGNVTVTVH